MTNLRAAVVALPAAAALLATVAGCTSSSDGTGTPPARATITTTATATSAAPPTGSGVPASGSATASGGGANGGGGNGGGGSGPGLCTPTVMTFVVGQESGASGTQYVPVIATNASQSSCVTTGYPGVALLDGSGNQYAQATRDSSAPSTTITVAPGQKVVASVGFRDVPSNGTGQCPTSTAFLFTLPDNTDSTKLTRSGPACGAVVQPFQRYTGN